MCQLTVVNNSIDLEDPRLAAAIVAVRDNLVHPLTVPELAAHAGASTRQLRRLFAQAFGATPSAYALRLRLDRARQLVLHTELRMLDVALAAGFEGPEHFSRRYKAAFGSAPLRDRKQHRPRLTSTAFPERIGNI